MAAARGPTHRVSTESEEKAGGGIGAPVSVEMVAAFVTVKTALGVVQPMGRPGAGTRSTEPST